MKSLNVHKSENCDDGILLSLQFLEKEAKKSSNENLRAVIQTAIEIIYAGDDTSHNKKLKTHENGQEIIDFLVAYILAPKNTKKNLAKILDILEEENE